MATKREQAQRRGKPVLLPDVRLTFSAARAGSSHLKITNSESKEFSEKQFLMSFGKEGL